MFWFNSTCSPPSPPACTPPCEHWGQLTWRPAKIINNNNNNNHCDNNNILHKKTEPGKLDVDVNTDLLQLDLLHPSLTRHRWHHFWHRLAHLHNNEMNKQHVRLWFLWHELYSAPGLINIICLTFVFKPCGNSAWARQCTPHVGFRPPWKITSCQHLFWFCL